LIDVDEVGHITEILTKAGYWLVNAEGVVRQHSPELEAASLLPVCILQSVELVSWRERAVVELAEV